MSGKTIMVVDDEKSMLVVVKTVLEPEGFEVITANSGKECLEMLKKRKPDLILMDMMMPGLSGRDTTEKIRKDKRTKDIKIAFLTVVSFSETGKEVLRKIGVIDYITKPFENEEFIKRIRKILGS